MPLNYKLNVLEALKAKGYSTFKLRHDKLLSEGAIQRLRDNAPLSWSNLEVVCSLLDCQLSDFIEYKK